MEIKRNGSQPSAKGPADWFTGEVRIDPLFQTPSGPGRRSERHIRAGCAHSLAYTSAWPNSHRDRRLRPGLVKKSTPAMLFGFHPARNTGTVPRRPPR